MSSDYAIGQFRFLNRLLFVHGHWSTLRVSDMILNFFYKNIIWVFVIYYFQFFCGFSSQVIYEFSLMLFYNLAFTSLPVIVLGIFDQDVGGALLTHYPQLYATQKRLYTTSRFWLYMLDGAYQSAVCFLIPLLVYWNATVSADGRALSLFAVGSVMASCAVINANLFVGLNIHRWTWLVIVTIFGMEP